MTVKEAIKILEVNVICSPKATEFKEAVEVITNEIKCLQDMNKRNVETIEFQRSFIDTQKKQFERLANVIEQSQSNCNQAIELIKSYAEKLETAKQKKWR